MFYDLDVEPKGKKTPVLSKALQENVRYGLLCQAKTQNCPRSIFLNV